MLFNSIFKLVLSRPEEQFVSPFETLLPVKL